MDPLTKYNLFNEQKSNYPNLAKEKEQVKIQMLKGFLELLDEKLGCWREQKSLFDPIFSSCANTFLLNQSQQKSLEQYNKKPVFQKIQLQKSVKNEVCLPKKKALKQKQVMFENIFDQSAYKQKQVFEGKESANTLLLECEGDQVKNSHFRAYSLTESGYDHLQQSESQSKYQFYLNKKQLNKQPPVSQDKQNEGQPENKQNLINLTAESGVFIESNKKHHRLNSSVRFVRNRAYNNNNEEPQNKIFYNTCQIQLPSIHSQSNNLKKSINQQFEHLQKLKQIYQMNSQKLLQQQNLLQLAAQKQLNEDSFQQVSKQQLQFRQMNIIGSAQKQEEKNNNLDNQITELTQEIEISQEQISEAEENLGLEKNISLLNQDKSEKPRSQKNSSTLFYQEYDYSQQFFPPNKLKMKEKKHKSQEIGDAKLGKLANNQLDQLMEGSLLEKKFNKINKQGQNLHLLESEDFDKIYKVFHPKVQLNKSLQKFKKGIVSSKLTENIYLANLDPHQPRTVVLNTDKLTPNSPKLNQITASFPNNKKLKNKFYSQR